MNDKKKTGTVWTKNRRGEWECSNCFVRYEGKPQGVFGKMTVFFATCPFCGMAIKEVRQA